VVNRRLFFGTILGVFVGSKVAPVTPAWGYTSGGQVGAITGSLRPIEVSATDKEFLEAATLSRDQVARWFDVPPELIGPPSTLTLNAWELPERVGVRDE
jgi:hypothetical protein